MWPITRNRPKPLLPMGEGTLLDAILDDLADLVQETIVSTNALFGDAFERSLQGRRDVRLMIEPQRSEVEKPGALGALMDLLDEVPPDEPVLVAAADNVYGFDMAAFVNDASRNDGPTVAARDLGGREKAIGLGVLEMGENGRVERFHEKPADPPSAIAATALYHYSPGWRDLFDDYASIARAAPREQGMLDAPGRILEWAAADGRSVYGWVFQEPWFDVGTATGYLEALRSLLGPRYVEGRVEDCIEGPGVFLFGDSQAHRSELTDVVLMPGAVVEDCVLRSTIVDEKAHLRGVELVDSLVGPHDSLNASRDRGQ